MCSFMYLLLFLKLSIVIDADQVRNNFCRRPVQIPATSECQMCLEVVEKARQISKTELEKTTRNRALLAANTYIDTNLKDTFINELKCHWKKYYNDINNNPSASPMSVCADTGYCPIHYQYQTPSLKIIDITNKTESYYTSCVAPAAILIHHTVTPTPEETIATLLNRSLSVQYIVAKNGTIYQMVRDWHGAWHAGAGTWRDMKSLNLRSIGIENVNDGHSPFSQAQITALTNLVDTLRNRWFVKDYNIIGHHDYAPDRKDDPSGYFPWSALYAGLGIFPGLFNTSLSLAEQQTVVISNCSYDELTLSRVQDGLQTYGYVALPMAPGKLEENTLYNMESFNRHFCPEVFVKELFNATTQTNIRNWRNQRWYRISDERLNYLLRQI